MEKQSQEKQLPSASAHRLATAPPQPAASPHPITAPPPAALRSFSATLTAPALTSPTPAGDAPISSPPAPRTTSALRYLLAGAPISSGAHTKNPGVRNKDFTGSQ
ncbi:classical arabinogalactan protein 7-like isoform X2 [Choloepus didactylus]|uniref:classical arabinogalactan protein 7-like isoform X2 n=1 Tax=Choloepus didactylus TaxID=27675 RepID=UPI00189E965D|nr:classical arabinogalactan protein 7-like isoform X2 [Choloepus didactylus]